MRLPGDAKILRMVIGSFEGWKNIGNSRDRYILLKDPLSGSKLALMRIAFEPDASCDKRPHATALAVEDTLTGEVAKTGKKMHELSEEETGRVLRKGDAVAVVPILEHGKKPFYDVHGVQCANWIIVRRSGGVINL